MGGRAEDRESRNDNSRLSVVCVNFPLNLASFDKSYQGDSRGD